MILMVMSEQDVVNRLGQVLIGIPRDAGLVCIAQHGIEKHADAIGLNENASVTKVTPSDSFSLERRISWRRVCCEKRCQKVGSIIRDVQQVTNRLERPGTMLQAE